MLRKFVFLAQRGELGHSEYKQAIYWPSSHNHTVIFGDKCCFVFSGRQTDLVPVNRYQGALKPRTVCSLKSPNRKDHSLSIPRVLCLLAIKNHLRSRAGVLSTKELIQLSSVLPDAQRYCADLWADRASVHCPSHHCTAVAY